MITEKISYHNSNGELLIADYREAKENRALVILVHGITADKESKGRFIKISEHLLENGLSTFAFDFSGCGESADTIMTAKSLCDDLKSTMNFVKKYNNNLVLWGHSIGAVTALKCCNESIAAMVLTGVCAGPMKFNWDEYFSPEQMAELEHSSFFNAKLGSKYRNKIKISGDVIEYLENFDQKEILPKIKCRCLLINGDQEIEEQTFRQITKESMTFFNKESKHLILQGANHSMNEYTEQIAALYRLDKSEYRN